MSKFNKENNPLGLDDYNLSLIYQLSNNQCELANAMAKYIFEKPDEKYSFFVTEEQKNITFALSEISVVRRYLNDAEKSKMLMQWVMAIVFSHEKKFQTYQDTFSMIYSWLENDTLIFKEIATTRDFPFATLLESVMKHLLAHLYITRCKTKNDALETGFNKLKLNESNATLGQLRNLFRDFCNYADQIIATTPFNDFSKVIKNARNSLSHYDPVKGIQEFERYKKAEFFVLTTFIYAATTLSIEKSRREGRRIILTCSAKVNDDDKFVVSGNNYFEKALEFKMEHIINKYPRCLVLGSRLSLGEYPLTVESPNHVALNQTIDVFRGSFLEEPILINIDPIFRNGESEGSNQPTEERRDREFLGQHPIEKRKESLTLDEKKKKAVEAYYEPRKRFKRGIVIQSILFSILFCIVIWYLWPLSSSKDWLEWIFHYAAVFGGTVTMFFFLRPKDRGLFVDIDDNGAVSIPGVSKLTFGQWLLTFCAWLFPLGLIVWIRCYAFIDDTPIKHFIHCWFLVFCWVWGMGAVLPCLLNGIARWNGFYYAPQWKFELPCTNATIGIKDKFDWYDKAKSYLFGFVGGRIVESSLWFSRTMTTSLVMLGIWFFFIYKYVPQLYEKEFGRIAVSEKLPEEKTRGEYYTKFEITQKELFMHVGDKLDIFKFLSYTPNIVEESFKWTTAPNGIVRINSNGIVEALATGETILTLSTEHSGFTGKTKVYVKAKMKKGTISGKRKESNRKNKNARSTQNGLSNDIPKYYKSLRFTRASLYCKEGDEIDLNKYLEKEPKVASEKIEWQLSIPELATITPNGILQALSRGDIIILILAKNADETTFIEVHIR